MPNILDTVQISGSSYDLKDKNAPSVSAVTQQEYDNLPSSAKTSNTFFVITDAQAGDLTQYWTSAQTQSAITSATSGKVDTSSLATVATSGSYNDLTNKPTIPTVPTSNTAFTNDAQYATSGYVDSVVSGKVDTSSVVTAVTSGSTDSEIPTAKAVYDATQGGGGGTTYTAGRGIDITNNTISFSLPISSSTETLLLTDSSNNISTTNSVVVIGASNNVSSSNSSRPTVKSIILGFSNDITSTSYAENKREKNYIIGNNNSVRGNNNVVIGANNIGYNSSVKLASKSYIIGDSNSLNYGNVIDKENNYIFGSNNKVYNSKEVSIGYYNNSVSDGTTSGTTFFSIGNGTYNARHNAFEIRQNGDMYLNNGTSDIKLQDYLQIKVVKLTQSAYDALSPNYDSNTLYIIKD